jgi:alpha-tubulin suppressor-like RCC1 family protein
VVAPEDGLSNLAPSVFELACDEPCTFECSLDGAPFAACEAELSFEGLSLDAPHTLAVRATDLAGNVEPTPKEHTWSLSFGWRSVGAAYDTMCAVGHDRALYCWGSDSGETLGDGPGGAGSTATPVQVGTATDWDEVFGGSSGFCARNLAGQMLCWGGVYGLGQGNVPWDVPTPFSSTLVRIEASYSHACGLDATGKLFCVGTGDNGRLGDGNGSAHYASVPLQVGSSSYVDLGVGASHACAIRDDGTLHCWGAVPLQTFQLVPTQVGTATDWEQVTAGDEHTCGIRAGGELYCWGYNYDGQLGLGHFDDEIDPVRVGTESDWIDVWGSSGGACATREGGLTFCWGENYSGELGSTAAPLSEVPTPEPLSGPQRYRRIASGGEVRCGQTSDRSVYCWGSNEYGALGRGVEPYVDAMFVVDSIFDAFADGDGQGGCGIASGQLLCWGSHATNGSGGFQSLPSPTPISTETDWTSVSLSTYYNGHGCAIRAEQLYCWGSNHAGQLGNGTTADAELPTPVAAVPGVTGWRSVVAGFVGTCAISLEDELYCWGSGALGQLGLGDQSDRSIPTKVAGTGWDSVDMGVYRSSGRRKDGTFWAWGSNVGLAPVQVPGTDWERTASVGFTECGIRTDGTMHCTDTPATSTRQAGTDTDFVGFVRSSGDTCGIDATGAIHCFSSGGSGPTMSPLPAIEGGTGWLSLVTTSTVCGLKAGKQRHCRGDRILGSLGDGFDERLPTRVVDP